MWSDNPCVLDTKFSSKYSNWEYKNAASQSLSLVSMAVINTMIKSNRGEEWVYSSLQFLVHHLGESGQVLKQEPGGKNCSRGHGGALVSDLLFIVLSEFLQHPGLLVQLLYLPQWTGPSHINYQSSGVLRWGSFFRNDSSLGQVDIKLARRLTKASLPLPHLEADLLDKAKEMGSFPSH